MPGELTNSYCLIRCWYYRHLPYRRTLPTPSPEAERFPGQVESTIFRERRRVPRGSLSPKSLSFREYGRGIFERTTPGTRSRDTVPVTNPANVSGFPIEIFVPCFLRLGYCCRNGGSLVFRNYPYGEFSRSSGFIFCSEMERGREDL